TAVPGPAGDLQGAVTEVEATFPVAGEDQLRSERRKQLGEDRSVVVALHRDRMLQCGDDVSIGAADPREEAAVHREDSFCEPLPIAERACDPERAQQRLAAVRLARAQ